MIFFALNVYKAANTAYNADNGTDPDSLFQEGIMVLDDAAEHNHDGQRPTQLRIQIDREHYTVNSPQMTGAGLRQVPTPPIGADRDLFEIIPGMPDHKVELAELVTIHNGQRFFTAPAHINPGGGR